MKKIKNNLYITVHTCPQGRYGVLWGWGVEAREHTSLPLIFFRCFQNQMTYKTKPIAIYSELKGFTKSKTFSRWSFASLMSSAFLSSRSANSKWSSNDWGKTTKPCLQTKKNPKSRQYWIHYILQKVNCCKITL